MNLWFHLLFGLLVIVFFLWEYLRKRRLYQLVFAVCVASTYLTYVSSAKWYQTGLGILELLLCLFALFSLWRARRQDQKQQREKAPYQEEEPGSEQSHE